MAETVMQNGEEKALATYKRAQVTELRILLQVCPKTKSTIFTDILRNKALTYSLLRRSRKMVFRLLSLVNHDNNQLRTTIYRKLTHTPDFSTNPLTTLFVTSNSPLSLLSTCSAPASSSAPVPDSPLPSLFLKPSTKDTVIDSGIIYEGQWL